MDIDKQNMKALVNGGNVDDIINAMVEGMKQTINPNSVNCPTCGEVVSSIFDHVDRDEFCTPPVSRFEKVFRIGAYLTEVGIRAKVEAESGEVRNWPDHEIDAVFEEIGPFEPRDNFFINH